MTIPADRPPVVPPAGAEDAPDNIKSQLRQIATEANIAILRDAGKMEHVRPIFEGDDTRLLFAIVDGTHPDVVLVSRAAIPQLWTCPDCAFAFDAMHTDEPGGGYTCPLCEVARLRAAWDRARGDSERLDKLATVLRERWSLEATTSVPTVDIRDEDSGQILAEGADLRAAIDALPTSERPA